MKKSFKDLHDALGDPDDVDEEQAMARMTMPLNWRRVRKLIARALGRKPADGSH